MPYKIKLTDLSTPQAWIIPDATAHNAGVMTEAQVAALIALGEAVDQLVAAGGAQALLDLESAVSQMPTPLVDEVETTDDTPLDVDLLSVLDNPSTALSLTVDIQAYDEDETQFFDAQLRASYKPGITPGEFEQYSGSVELYKQTDGIPAWTAELTQAGGSTLPALRLIGAADTIVVWKIYVAMRSAP